MTRIDRIHNDRGRVSALRKWVALSAALWVLLGGCETIKELRGLFHPEEVDQDLGGAAGLHMKIDPEVGLRISIDGEQVGDTSPLTLKGLEPGAHHLSVEAPGYHPFSTGLMLEANKMVEVLVALRPLAHRNRSDRKGTATLDAEEVSRPPPALPDPPAPPLPPGIRAVTIVVSAWPEVPLLLDGVRIHNGTARLDRVSGRLTAGVLALDYRVGSRDVLALTLPEGEAMWLRDGKTMAPGDTFMLYRGVVRLRRIAVDGTDQILLLRRAEAQTRPIDLK